MNIEELKEALGDKYDGLKSYVDDLIAQREAARNESINGRKTLKARVNELEALQTKLFDKLGVETVEDIESLPDGKGQAEAMKQFEAKVKRLERELADEQGKSQTLTSQLRDTTLNVNLEKALNAHDWLDRDVAATIIKNGVVFEEDSHRFKTETGSITLEEAAQQIAKSKAFLLKSSGAGGSGYTGKDGKKNADSSSTPPDPKSFPNMMEYAKASAKFHAEQAANP